MAQSEESQEIFISAGETSGETYAANFYKYYIKKHPDSVGFGLGGEALGQLGFKALRDTRDHLVMGFVEILHKLPLFRKSLAVLTSAVRKRRPKFGVLVDYPGFHFKLAQKIHRTTPLYYLIPPKVWAWKKHRLLVMPKLFKKVFLIFPFEQPIYREANVNFSYIGNPLLYQLPVKMDRLAAREALSLHPTNPLITIMAGSRPAEFQMHVPLLTKAMSQLSLKLAGEKLQFVVPVAHRDDEKYLSHLKKTAEELRADLKVIVGNSGIALRASDAAWIKSGTSSLEAAICDTPHVVFYKANRVSEWIVKNVIRYDQPISLVNWLGKWAGFSGRVVEELVLEGLTPERLADSVATLLVEHSTARTEMLAQFAAIRATLECPFKGFTPLEYMVEEIDREQTERTKEAGEFRASG